MKVALRFAAEIGKQNIAMKLKIKSTIGICQLSAVIKTCQAKANLVMKNLSINELNRLVMDILRYRFVRRAHDLPF